jgi:hypothetical protein
MRAGARLLATRRKPEQQNSARGGMLQPDKFFCAPIQDRPALLADTRSIRNLHESKRT